MAVPTLGNVPTTLDDAESTTGWTSFTTLDTDLIKEGSNSVSGILRTDLSTGYYDIITDGGAAQNMTGRHVRVWINFSTIANLDTEINNGMEFFMYDGTNTAYWVAFGSDTYSGGWKNYVLDCGSTPDSGSFDITIVRRWGFRFNRISAPANKINTWVDYVRWGDGYYATGGVTGDRIEFSGIQSVDETNGYGIVEIFEGIYFSYGEITVGNGATTTWFDMVGDVLVFTDSAVATGLYALIGTGSGCRVNIDSSVIRASGTTDATRFNIDMSDSGLLSCTIIDTFISRASTIIFNSGQTITGNTFNDCGIITHGGATMNNSSISAYEGTANTSALIYNINADPDGEMDGMSFAQGTALTHAIEFGTTSPTTMTIRNVDFGTGYTNTQDQNNSTFHFRRGSPDIVTLNLIGCTGTNKIGFRTDGADVTIVDDPATVSVTVRDNNQALLFGARVILKIANDSGTLPFEESVTITSSGNTASVSHTGHGLSNGQKVEITGANEGPYNGAKIIFNQSANAYDYNIDSPLPSSPATGTIVATAIIIEGTTDSSGFISDSRVYVSDEDMTGRVSDATATPYFKDSPLSVGVVGTDGAALSVQMILDE